MKIQHKLSKRISSAATIMALVAMMGVPIMSSATTVNSGAAMQIDSSSLSTSMLKPTISGTATGMKKVKVTIRKEDSTKILFKKSGIKVKDGIWRVKVSKKLVEGDYIVSVSGVVDRKAVTVDETLIISNGTVQSAATSKSTLAVGSIPLLSGGTARAGSTVPVSYLQITNTGKELISLKGFSLAQNSLVSIQSVIGFTSVDDRGDSRGSVGGVEGSVVFKNGQAYVPANTVLAPGEMRLFTIKAMLSANVSAYIGQQLALDVISVDSNSAIKAVFPIRGTTWTIAR